MADPNITLGYDLGRGLSLDQADIPVPLTEPADLARFVDEVDCMLFVDGQGIQNWVGAGQNLRHMAQVAIPAMPEVEDSLIRAGITLRLWAGCLWAAKPLDRPELAAADREQMFRNEIDPRAQADDLFRAGVEAAPAFNALPTRSGCVPILDGVPASSPVFRHLGS